MTPLTTSSVSRMQKVKGRAKLLLSLLPISSLIILLVFTLKPFKDISTTFQNHHLHLQTHLQVTNRACEGTLYPELCSLTLSSIPNITSKSVAEIISASVNVTVKMVEFSAANCTNLKKNFTAINTLEKKALDDCIELFDYTVEELSTALCRLSRKSSHSSKRFHQLQTLFSAAMTNQYTCLDGFAYSDGNVRDLIEERLHKISHLLSNSLAMLKKIRKKHSSRTRSTEDLFPEYGEMKGGFPKWVSRRDRKLLDAPKEHIKFDLVVAKDKSGNFTTIGDAVNAAPESTKHRFIIYIKEGGYFENVAVPNKKPNIMFVGDGIGKTVVKAGRSVVDGWTTYQIATVAVVGDAFIARDITFENSAGPEKHQAVALRSGSDTSAFYRCSFVGYQDTLYAHSFRQFYRECDIYGTVDFIFGNSAAVFQNCSLYARKPLPKQQNIFTAQGREDPNQNTGISIIGSKLAAAASLLPEQAQFKSYLGRPWKRYSRTVYIQCQLDSLIDPEGWSEWNGDFGLSTLYYGEYKNVGPGSNTSRRVKWPGYRVMNNPDEAKQFTVGEFLLGNDWLPSYDIPYSAGLG